MSSSPSLFLDCEKNISVNYQVYWDSHQSFKLGLVFALFPSVANAVVSCYNCIVCVIVYSSLTPFTPQLYGDDQPGVYWCSTMTPDPDLGG